MGARARRREKWKNSGKLRMTRISRMGEREEMGHRERRDI